MKRAILACAVSIAALTGSISAARAWEWWLGPSHGGLQRSGDWYIDASGAGGVLQFPRLSGFTVFQQAGGPLGTVSTRHVIGAAGGGLTFGRVLSDGALPPWLGSRVRVEFQGSYRGGSSREQNVFAVPPGVAAEILEINLLGKDVRPGANTGITNGGPTFPLVMSSRIESAAFDMALRARSDFLVRPGVIFSPSIGVFGGRSTDDYDIATFFDRSNVVGGTIANPTSIDARQRTWRFGGDVGADVTLRADTGIAFHFGGRVGINHVRTSLDASDCISTALTLPKGTPCATAPSRFTSSLSTSRNTIGIRTSASGGATINLVYALVGIGGFVSYDTKTPIFQTQTQTSTGFPQTGSPAGIRFVGALSYGGYASIRVPFGL